MPGPARLDASVADNTALYLCSSDTCPPRKRVIWRMRADVRGNFPGYLTLPDALLDARVELTSDYLFVDCRGFSFAIPATAIERVALISAIDRPDGAILQVDYCDAARTVRRFWLRDARRRKTLPSTSRLSEFAARFETTGVERTETGDVVTGLRSLFPLAGLKINESRSIEWSCEAAITLASGDYIAEIALVDTYLQASITNSLFGIWLSDVAGYTMSERKADGGSRVVFLTFWEDDTRVDLRLSIFEEPGVSVSFARKFAELLRRHGIANLREDRGSPARVTSRDRFNVGGAPGASRFEVTGLPGLFEIPRDTQGVKHQAEEECQLAGEGVAGETRHGRASENDMLRVHVTARLQALRNLRDADLISDEDWQRQRARVLIEVDVIDRLFQLQTLRSAGLISVEEYDGKRAELVEDL